MAMQFICLTTSGGVPLFCRSTGGLKQLPFPVIGSLNGVHMFANSHEVELQSTVTEDSKLVWKVYHNSLTLIMVAQDDNASDSHLSRILDLIFQAMVLLYGLDDLTNIKNVERFKKEIKVCFHLVDKLLELAVLPGFSDLTLAVDTLMAAENAILQAYLEAFCDAANSPYGCVSVGGTVAAATTKWWQLKSVELVLLSLLLQSLPKCNSRDIPVFLPITSPKVPHRLMTYTLIQGVEVCVLCGPAPTLTELEQEVERFWRQALDPLKSVARITPRNLPPGFQLDNNILGFLIIDQANKRSLCSVEPHEDVRSKNKNAPSPEQRRNILRAFYKHVVGSYWKPSLVDEEKEDQFSDAHETLQHTVTDTYICTDTHKCYALTSNSHQIFVLYNAQIPTYAMRSVTQKTLQAVSKDKSSPI